MGRNLQDVLHLIICLVIMPTGVVEAACQTQHCEVCNGDTCTTCSAGYYLYNNGCYPCHTRCTVCTGSSYSQCSACTDGYYRSGSTCDPCNTRCTLCSGSSHTQCSGCKDGYYLSGSRCIYCSSSCDKCSSYVSCSECESGTFRYLSSGYYRCYQCPTGCPQCYAINYVFQDTICTECSSGYFKQSNECTKCPTYCTACISSTSCSDCVTGRWGTQCQTSCGTHCTGNECTPSTGACTQGCDGGYYGQYCTDICRDPCLTCTSLTACQSCTEGNYLDTGTCSPCVSPCTKCSSIQCTECLTGYYGTSCQSTCTTCKPNVCDKSGVCTHGCVNGYGGSYCNIKCSDSCLTCTSSSQCQTCADGTFLKQNFSNIYCQSCPDYCATCTSMSSCQSCSSNHYNANPYVKCECDTRKCISNTVQDACTACTHNTWYTTGSGCCPCIQKCKDQRCRSDRSCSDGCVRGYYGDICQYTCQDYDAQCRECSGNNTSDFVCTECQTWYFPSGSGCQVCNGKCKYNGGDATCDSRNGTCIEGCKDGLFGDKCDSQCPIGNCEVCADTNGEITCDTCVNNYYKESDKNCSSCSSHCYDNTVCSKVNGSCTEGCGNGWHGDRCDRECPPGCVVCNQDDGACTVCNPGKHGVVCEYECSIGCISINGSVTCAQIGGTCTHGCVTGHWNNTCEHLCNDGCLNSKCDTSTGHCLDGCLQEYFGNSCESRCSDNCLEVEVVTDTNLCRREGGACIGGCKAGYYGDTCGEACESADRQQASGMEPALGGGLGALVVIIVVAVTICVLYRKGYRINKPGNASQKYTGNTYENDVEIAENPATSNRDPSTGSPYENDVEIAENYDADSSGDGTGHHEYESPMEYEMMERREENEAPYDVLQLPGT